MENEYAKGAGQDAEKPVTAVYDDHHGHYEGEVDKHRVKSSTPHDQIPAPFKLGGGK